MTRTRMGTAAALAAATLLAGMLFAGDAGADWLVLADGSRVETDGAWEVKGRQIVFHTADGTLSSLKTEQVDLGASREATRAATERAARPAPPPPAREPEPETPRRKFTNADIPRGAVVQEPVAVPEGAMVEGEAPPGAIAGDAAPEGAEAADAPADAAPADASAAADAAPGSGMRAPGDVVVTAWDREPLAAGDGIQIAGTLRNDRPGTTATSVQVEVVLYDRSGQEVASVAASVEPTSIPDGGSADFVAVFPDVFDFGAVRFNASSRAIEQAPAEPAGATTPNR